MRFQVGQTVGDYELLDVVASSPTGVTYRVRNALADRQELLKVLPRDLQDDPERTERFLREAKIHARLHHPNIASFYSATHIDDQLVMTTELVEGTSLEECLQRGDSLPLERAKKYFEQALSALSYAHREGVVHRDLTPAHLIISPGDTVKVTGFGLAKKSSDPQLTQPGIVLGSVHYMSPEQVKGSADLDRRSDIYSLGIVLYEAVTGKKPFDSKSQFEVFLAHVNEEPAPPSSVRPEIPPQLDEIILTAIAKQPANRFQTAEEFQESLGKLQSILENPVAERGAAPPPQAHGSVSENPVGQAADPPVETTPGERVAAGTSAPGDPRDDAARSESGWLESAPNSVPVSVSHGVADSVTDAAAAPVVESAAGSVAEPAPVSPRVAARVPADVGETNPVMPEAFLPPPAEASGCWDVLSVDRDLGDGDGSQASSPPNPQPASEEPAFAPGHTGWSEDPARSRSTSSTSERTTPANESADHSKPVPILLRPSGDTGGYPRYSPPVDDSPAEPESPEPSRPGEQTFAGWSSKDILAVGALMFVIVAAVFFTLLTFLNYR